jgi:hypothetical protein
MDCAVFRFPDQVDLAEHWREIHDDVGIKFECQVVPVFGKDVKVSRATRKERNSGSDMARLVEFNRLEGVSCEYNQRPRRAHRDSQFVEPRWSWLAEESHPFTCNVHSEVREQSPKFWQRQLFAH